jgi:cell division protein FtsA
MADGPIEPIKLFYCYSHVDKALRDDLDLRLKPLERLGLVKSWYDGEITPGSPWAEEIDNHLNTADIILLLISPEFIASDSCFSEEMVQAIARHDAGDACVIPILLRPTLWQDAPFSKLQMLPKGAQAVTSWPDRDEALLHVTKGIDKAIKAYTRAKNQRRTIRQPPSTPPKIPDRRSRTFQEQEEYPAKNRNSIYQTIIGFFTQGKKQYREIEQPLSALSQSDVDYQRQFFTALDIGTAFAKAIIIEVVGDQAEVLGVGRHPQSYTHMSDGIVTNISGVIANCNEALLKAEKAAGGLIAPSAVIGIAGELVKGSSITVSRQRQKPTIAITTEELDDLITQAQKRLLKSARERIATETGYENIDVRLINTAVISVRIDGHVITNPVGFKGRNFSLTLFSAFAPLTQLGALESIAQGLDLTLSGIVAEPYALARCLSANAGVDSGAIFIDVGGGTTDIALVRQGGIEETRMFALGGRAFTHRIATSKGISLQDAERIKISYSNRHLRSQYREEIQAILAPECQTWMDIVELLIGELAKGGLLPPAIYIVGGGSALPDLYERLESFPWTERLPFSRPPIIRMVLPEMVASIIDHDRFLTTAQDITPMALAYQAVESSNENDVLEEALNRVINAMRI